MATNQLILFAEPDVASSKEADRRPSLEEILTELRDPPPAYELWLRNAVAEGHLPLVASALQQTGEIAAEAEAPRYLCERARAHPIRDLTRAWCDFQGEKHCRPFRILERLLGPTPAGENPNVLYRQHGVRSHAAIGELVTGRIPTPRNGSMENDGTQLRLLDTQSDPRSETLFPLREPGARFRDAILPNGRVKDAHLDRIQCTLEQASATLTGCRTWVDIYQNGKPYLWELHEMLAPIFDQHLTKLEGYASILHQCMFLLTLLEWASALLTHALRGPRALFREIPPLAHCVGVGGGRTDATEVVTINDRPPSRSEREILEQMSTVRFPSIGYLMRALERAIGPRFLLRIIDWKFAVGDGEHATDLLIGQNLFRPRRRDVEQVSQYLTLAAVDEHLVTGSTPERIWREDGHFAQGEVVYFPLGSPPITHTITLDPEEQQERFARSVAAKWPYAESRAILRMMNNLLVGPEIDRLKNASNSRNRIRPHPERLSLPLEMTTSRSPREGMERLVRVAYESLFLDPQRLIERVGKNQKGETLWALHVDQFLKALEQGSIAVDRHFQLPRGGFISCLNPDHADQHPSMYVYLQRGFFKCFSCGFWGVFDPSSLPAEYQIPEEARVWHKMQKTLAVVIPPEHVQIMGTAQQILQENFRGSPGEEYLAVERRLDLDMVYTRGAGFGRDSLIHGLLDRGWSYDQLIHFGFIGLSPTISTQQGIYPLLSSRGLGLNQIRREITIVHKSERRSVWALPYSPLQDRVTFPLEYEGMVTNIYGRAVKPKLRKHAKLSNEHTGVPHGACNMAVLGSDHPEVIVVEGVMDMFVLLLLGYEPTLAAVNLDNLLITEAIGRSGKAVGLALDNDDSGRRATLRITDRLRRAGVEAPIRNFTADFLECYPDAATFEDYNAWWTARANHALATPP